MGLVEAEGILDLEAEPKGKAEQQERGREKAGGLRASRR